MSLPSRSAAPGRYLRHTQIDGLSQDALGALRVLVIGAGAIGNEVVKNLTLLGVGRITILDRDDVEVHNLTRSVLLRETDIGASKAVAVAQHARELDGAVEIVATHGDIFECLSIEDVIAHDVIIAALDNFEARIRINQLAWLTARSWINAGIDARHASVEVFPFSIDGPSACYECGLPETVYQRLAERMSCGGLLRAHLAQRVMPTTTLSTSIAGALAVGEALVVGGCDHRRSIDEQAKSTSQRVFFDSLSGRAHRSDLAVAELCAGCGAYESPVTHLGQASSIADALALFADPGGEQHYELSDRIIWHAQCARCGIIPAEGQFVGRRAASLSDAVTWCARCGASSVEIDIRDNASGAELATKFGATMPALAWLTHANDLVSLPCPAGAHREPVET